MIAHADIAVRPKPAAVLAWPRPRAWRCGENDAARVDRDPMRLSRSRRRR